MNLVEALPPALIPIAIGFLIGGVVAAVWLGLMHGDGAADPENNGSFIKPLLVFVTAFGLWADVLPTLSGQVVFGLAFALAILCGLTSIAALRAGRDYVLSTASIVMSVLLLVQRLSSGWDVAVVYLLYVAALAAGIAFGGLFKAAAPVSGMAFLGGVVILDYLVSPFGIALFGVATPQVLVLGAMSAIFIGVLFRVKQLLVLHLSSVSVTFIGICLPAMIFLAHSSSPESFPFQPDWTQALAVLGCMVGYACGRLPYTLVGLR